MTNEALITIEDEIYSLSKLECQVDKSSMGRSANTYAASTNGNAPLSAALNAIGAQTVFRFDMDASRPLRWNTLGLRIRSVITKYGDTTKPAPVLGGSAGLRTGHLSLADQPYDSIDTFALAEAISSIKLSINGVQVMMTNTGDYTPFFISSLILNHSHQSLEHHPALFTPIFDQQLTAASSRFGKDTPHAWSATAAEPWHLNDVDGVRGPLCYTQAVAAGAAVPANTATSYYELCTH